MHDALKAAPAVAEILALRRPGEQLDPLRKRLFAITADARLTEQEAADTLRAATSFVIGFTLITSPEDRHRRYAASADSFSFGLELIMRSARELANTRERS